MSDDEEEKAAADAAAADDPAGRARSWLLSSTKGALATLAADPAIEGYPFGSVVPYAVDATGAPIVLIADIAAHTKNLQRDPRASLLVQEDRVDGDPQAGWRVTVVGTMTRLGDGDPALRARYRAVVPAADAYEQTHGFAYWRLDAVKLRFIGGFGKICWLEPAQVRLDPRLDGADGAIAHMNEDHVDALRDLARGFYGLSPATARMTSMDRTGFAVDVDGRLLWFRFDAPVEPQDVRGAVVRLVQQARRRSGGAA